MMTIQVEEIAFGKVFRTLDTMPGVIAINLHGSGPKEQTTSSPPRRTGGATVECLILGALRETKVPLTRTTLTEVIVQGGKAASSFQDAISKLVKKKHVTKGVDGNYKITAAGSKRYESACELEAEAA